MNEMNCQRAIDLLIDFVARELPAEQMTALEEHFRRCPPCLIYMESYQLTIRMTRQLPREAPLPPEMESRLLAVMRATLMAESEASA